MNKKIDISDTVIKTERLVLRPWNDGDLQDFYKYASVDGVCKYDCTRRNKRSF